jgi:hypothetical protein
MRERARKSLLRRAGGFHERATLARRLHRSALVMLDTRPRAWLERGARFGHFMRGILYGLIGVLTLQTAVGAGGQVAGNEEAARFVGDQPFGRVLLLLLGAGLAGYALWRLVEGAGGAGGNEKATKRVAALVSGVANGAFAVAVFQTALGQRSGSGARSWVGALLEQSFGAFVVGLIGAGVVVAGVVQLYEAYTKKFLEDFRLQSLSNDERRWITRAGQVGYSARGVVFPIVGLGFLRAALAHDASQTRGVREALLEIAHSGGGQILLGLVAAGFLAFGLFMIASARYRNIAC